MNEGMRRYLDSLPEGSVKHFTMENCPALVEYDRQMREETIPAIERAMKAQQRAAHFACLGIPDPLASRMEAQRGETAQTGSTAEGGDSLTAESGDAQTPVPSSRERK